MSSRPLPGKNLPAAGVARRRLLGAVNRRSKENKMNNGMIESTYTDDKARKYYNWRASNYDLGAGFEEEFHEEAVRLADAQSGQHVLVVACGTGRGMIELAQAVGSTGRVDALDLSEQMIEQARAKSEALGLTGQVHFKQGNAKELPYPD